MPGYDYSHLLAAMTKKFLSEPFPDSKPGDQEYDMTQDLIVNIAQPIHEHIVSWWNELGGGTFPDETVKMIVEDPISGYLADKIDNDTIKYDNVLYKLYVDTVPVATSQKVGGILVGVSSDSVLYIENKELKVRVNTAITLSDSNTEIPTCKSVKAYVDNSIQNLNISGGIGDMLKSTYDVNNDGIVDNSERLGGNLPNYYATKVHSLVDIVNHTVSGLTTGTFLKALSPTSYGFTSHGLTYTDVNAAPTEHSHGNISNTGAIGSTGNLPIITDISGNLITGNYGLTFIGNGTAQNQILITGASPFTPIWVSANNLVSLNGLTYVSSSFVKMTGNGTFTLDTTNYEPALVNTPGNGYILSSLTNGTRSWISVPSSSQWTTDASGIYYSSNVGIGGSSSSGGSRLIVTPTSSHTNGILTYAELTNSSIYLNTIGGKMTSTSSGTHYFMGNKITMEAIVNNSITNSAAVIGQDIQIMRYISGSTTGTLSTMAGTWIAYGHNTSIGTTTTAYGLRIDPYIGAGTITTMYDIYLGAESTGGTATTSWAIYQANTKNSRLNGQVGIGKDPVYGLDVNGTIAVKGAIRLGYSGNNYVTTIQANSQSTDLNITLPAAAPAGNDYLLVGSTSGVMTWTNALSGTLTASNIRLTAPTTLSGTTPTWNINTSSVAHLTLSGNTTLSISNAVAGDTCILKVIQGSGSYTLTLPSGSKKTQTITISTTNGAIDILTFYYDGTYYYWNQDKNYV